MFEPLRLWVNGSIQRVYVAFGLSSMAACGWAILRTGVLPRWVGWVTFGRVSEDFYQGKRRELQEEYALALSLWFTAAITRLSLISGLLDR